MLQRKYSPVIRLIFHLLWKNQLITGIFNFTGVKANKEMPYNQVLFLYILSIQVKVQFS